MQNDWRVIISGDVGVYIDGILGCQGFVLFDFTIGIWGFCDGAGFTRSALHRLDFFFLFFSLHSSTHILPFLFLMVPVFLSSSYMGIGMEFENVYSDL